MNTQIAAQTARTPGPWVIETTEGGVVQITDSATETHCIATTRKRIDAAFIVKACNAHDDLLNTLCAIANESTDFNAVAFARAALAKAGV